NCKTLFFKTFKQLTAEKHPTEVACPSKEMRILQTAVFLSTTFSEKLLSLRFPRINGP
ncbi:hypothetical protein BY454_108111, partial [Marinobacter persicus]